MALPDLKKYFHAAQMRPAICGCVSDYEAKLETLTAVCRSNGN